MAAASVALGFRMRVSGRPRPSFARQAGYSIVELIAVMAILSLVLTALTSLFVAGVRAELDANRRFQAQQSARVAVDRMRRDARCASGLAVSADQTSATLTLCPTSAGVVKTVVYDTTPVSEATDRYLLRRNGVQIADYLTAGAVFSETTASNSLRTLHLDLPVNLTPAEPARTWRLETDLVLRNTVRGAA